MTIKRNIRPRRPVELAGPDPLYELDLTVPNVFMHLNEGHGQGIIAVFPEGISYDRQDHLMGAHFFRCPRSYDKIEPYYNWPAMYGWSIAKSRGNTIAGIFLDTFGTVHVHSWSNILELCHNACREASGYVCECRCQNKYHGDNCLYEDEHYKPGTEIIVREIAGGEIQRRTFNVKVSTGQMRFYRGELNGVQYTPRSNQRLVDGWPLATEFACAACLTERAEVWDHCHEHLYVRAPLCNLCNTYMWHGHGPVNGRRSPRKNVSRAYYNNCPDKDDTCSL